MTAKGITGRDITELLADQGERRQPMPGFDPDYVDIVDYIIRCTHRIWEQKDVGLIDSHYAPDIVVHTMTGPAHGMGNVIAATARTLSAFPDRTLIGEAVIWSDEGEGKYLSSHRITSLATNTGPSDFGPATGRSVAFTTVADCLCKANLIIEEWLVRDNSALVFGLGASPRAVARAQAATDYDSGPQKWRQDAMAAVFDTVVRAPLYQAFPSPKEPHAFAAAVFGALLGQRHFGLVRNAYSPAARWFGPGGRRLFGWGEITGWFTALVGTFGDIATSVDHVAASDDQIAVRWSMAGSHDGPALYGPPSGRKIYILGVTHWRIADCVIIEETTVFDEIALLRQIEGGL